jgi:hypothetical protein
MITAGSLRTTFGVPSAILAPSSNRHPAGFQGPDNRLRLVGCRPGTERGICLIKRPGQTGKLDGMRAQTREGRRCEKSRISS